MRALWERLHANVMRSTETLSFRRHYESIRQSNAALRAFRDPSALLEHLHAEGESADEKNGILAALVTAAQNGDPAREAAGPILWLALWPGLDAEFNAAADRLHALRRLYTLARDAGALGSDCAIDAVAAMKRER